MPPHLSAPIDPGPIERGSNEAGTPFRIDIGSAIQLRKPDINDETLEHRDRACSEQSHSGCEALFGETYVATCGCGPTLQGTAGLSTYRA